MVKFIHSSDLHLGKRFGNFSGDLPSRLREARHAVLGRLGEHALREGASTIILAGDTFDTETPAADVRRQALAEMAAHRSVRWIILPGNHDSLKATELWSMLQQDAPENVVLVTKAEPIELAPEAVLLPAPCTVRRPGRDLSEWMDLAESRDGMIRIGVAHGPIQTFSEDSGASEVIVPDRARRAGLDYLALGDWHGSMKVDARTYYSGTPEQDRFKHDRSGTALLVDIEGPGVIPTVTELETSTFSWRTLDLHLLDDSDPLAALAPILPDGVERRHTLARVEVSGRTGLAGRKELTDRIDRLAPEFALLDLDLRGLATECEIDDLDLIDRGGALREAADALLAESDDESRSAEVRTIAAAALTRLYGYAQERSA